jgi:hypothetical protein
MKRTLLATISALALTGSVNASEISCSPMPEKQGEMPTLEPCLFITLKGEIVKGDYKKVESSIRSDTWSIVLESPGGDVDEALKIGHLLRKHLFYTYANNDEFCHNSDCKPCASACALIWFGGVIRKGQVGLHRPYFTDPAFKGLSPTDASTKYNRMLDDIEAYLSEMEAPRSIIESMKDTRSGDIHWMDADKDGLKRPRSIAEWVDASCGKDDPEAEEKRAGDNYLKAVINIKPEEEIIEARKKVEDAKRRTGIKFVCEADLFMQHRNPEVAPWNTKPNDPYEKFHPVDPNADPGDWITPDDQPSKSAASQRGDVKKIIKSLKETWDAIRCLFSCN